MKWGLRWELCIIIVFIICLLIATIGLNKFGLLSNDSGVIRYVGPEEGDTYSYNELESQIAQAGSRYYKSRYPKGISESKKVSVETLINAGYLNTLYDGSNRRCTGYAYLSTRGSSFGYLKCHRYRTEGYDLDYE